MATPPGSAGKARDIGPFGDGSLGCVQMYSACTPDGDQGNRCTSARFDLACGETGKVPNGGDVIRCVCP